MFRSRRNHSIPELNTTSTADISFMLLIFFLVTTSLDTDKGITRQLPPPPREDVTEEMTVKNEDLMNVSLDENDILMCDDKTVTLKQLTRNVEDFVVRRGRKHVISVQADRNTSYEAYFSMQNAIVAAYTHLRDREARRKYGHSFRECSPEEREVIAKMCPQRISEADPSDEGGGL